MEIFSFAFCFIFIPVLVIYFFLLLFLLLSDSYTYYLLFYDIVICLVIFSSLFFTTIIIFFFCILQKFLSIELIIAHLYIKKIIKNLFFNKVKILKLLKKSKKQTITNHVQLIHNPNVIKFA